jgi:hypothetical protein
MEKQRTIQQNKALHKYFELLAKELNDAGLDMRTVLKPEININWTEEMIKEHLWRPVQKLQFGKESTTELTTTEINKVWETLNMFLSEKFGVFVDFPHEDVE